MTARWTPLLSSLVPVLACSLLSSCAGAPRACAGFGGCEQGYECLANRCVPAGGEPVTPSSRRLVLEPSALSVVSPEHGGEVLPDAVHLGREGLPEERLYLSFEPRWSGSDEIESAFLLLYPLPDTQPSPEDVSLSVWRIAERWDPERLSWLGQPKVEPPEAHGVARTGLSPVRIDVTEAVRFFQAHPGSIHGLSLRASEAAPFGVSVSTGARGASGPLLEIYLMKKDSP